MSLQFSTRFMAAVLATIGLCLVSVFLSVVSQRALVEDELMDMHEASARAASLRLAASEFAVAFEPRFLQDAHARAGEVRQLLGRIDARHSGGDAIAADLPRWQQALAGLKQVEGLIAQQLSDLDSEARSMPDGHVAALLRMDSLALEEQLLALNAPWARTLDEWNLLAKSVAIAFALVFTGVLVQAVRLLHSRILRPLDQLISAVQSVSGGQLGIRVNLQSTDEIGALAHAFDAMLDRLQEYTVSRARLEQEVGERRQVEAALRESERRQHLALGAAEAGVWDWNMLTGAMTWSAECFALYGIDPADCPPGHAGWLALVHDEDRPATLAGIENVLAAGTEWTQEFRIRHPERGVRWLLSRGRIEYRADGALLGLSGISLDITEKKAAEAKIHHLAHHDALTGLLNRFSLRQSLDQAIAAARRKKEHLAVLFIDMDRFKAINDSLGHDAGDRVLVEVARRLHSGVRESDLVARLGGDEFVVVLTGISLDQADQAYAKIPGIARRLAKAYTFDGHLLNTSPSIGVSLFPADGIDADTLLKNADTAMYHAKAQGRNNCRFFSATMNQAVVERLQLEQALRQADPRREFFLHFQPQLSALDARLVGFEALMRWQHPELGLVPPERFIPVAEESGVIHTLGRWVLENACDQLWELKRQGWSQPRMAVNLSLHQLRDPELVDFLHRLIHGYELEPEELELEITETTAMADPEFTVAVLNRLRAMGISLSIDDFGTGYSSLAHLKRLPVQRLKLDKSLVQDIETDPDNAHICRATIALAHSLGLEVAADGVETEAQLDYLIDLGCDTFQGYYCSRPLPAREAEAFLARQRAVAAAPGIIGASRHVGRLSTRQ